MRISELIDEVARLKQELEKSGRRFESIRRRLELILLDEDGGLDLFSDLGQRVIPKLHDSALRGRDMARAALVRIRR